MRALGAAIILIAIGACGGDEPGAEAAQGKGDGELTLAGVHCTAHQFCELRKDGEPDFALRQLCCSWAAVCETPLRAALADASCAPDPSLDAAYCITPAGECPLTEARKRTDRCECSGPWGTFEGYAS